MKGNHIKKVLISAATIAACSILTALPVYADDTYSDDVWAYRAVANVVEAVNIRAAASEDSTIVGYLTTAASADVIERGETWSLVISGGVEGYVRNDCLAFGEDAKNLAGVYGSEGVKTYWDGVSLFAAPDGSSEVLATVSAGKEYEVLSNDGSWVEVQMDDATVAYVPAEDVMETTILDKAVSTGDAYGSVSGSSNSGSYDSSYSDMSYDDGSSYSDSSYDDATAAIAIAVMTAMMTEAPTATIATTRAMIAATAIPATMTEVPTLIAAMTRAMTTAILTAPTTMAALIPTAAPTRVTMTAALLTPPTHPPAPHPATASFSPA